MNRSVPWTQTGNELISTEKKSPMDDLSFKEETFDVIWSGGGAIYIIGFKKGAAKFPATGHRANDKFRQPVSVTRKQSGNHFTW